MEKNTCNNCCFSIRPNSACLVCKNFSEWKDISSVEYVTKEPFRYYGEGPKSEGWGEEVPAGTPITWSKKCNCFFVPASHFTGMLKHDATFYGCRVDNKNIKAVQQ